MAIAKELVDVHKFFVQECPFCKRSNRIVMNGLFVLGDKVEKHPDMGYSFCNCKNMFYTRPENVVWPARYDPDENGIITLPDPFFAWPDPYEFRFWDVRRYKIIWPLDSLCERLKELGYEIESTLRDFDLYSKTPQHYHIKVKNASLS